MVELNSPVEYKPKIWICLYGLAKALAHFHLNEESHRHFTWLNMFVPCLAKTKYVVLDQTSLVRIPYSSSTSVTSMSYDILCWLFVALSCFQFLFQIKQMRKEEDDQPEFPSEKEKEIYQTQILDLSERKFLVDLETKTLEAALQEQTTIFILLSNLESIIKLHKPISNQDHRFLVQASKVNHRSLSSA